MNQETLLKQLKSDDSSERREAVEELGNSGSEEFIPQLITTLKDKNPGVQQAAVDALINIGTAEVVKGVIPLLRDEMHAAYRNMAVEILGRVGSKDIESITSLMKEEDADVRRFAADILGIIGDQRGGAALIAALKDPNPNIRSSAANSIGMIGFPNAILPLIESLKAENEDWVRFSLIETLGKIGDERIIEHLTPFLEENNEVLTIAAIEALKKFNIPIVAGTLIHFLEVAGEGIKDEVLKTLVDMLETCPDCFPRESMLKRLSAYFLSALADEDMDVRYAAVKGLGIIKEKRAVKPLISLMKGLNPAVPEDEEKGRLIYKTLKEIGDEGGLIRGLETYGPDTPINVIDLIGEFRSKKAVKRLIEIFEPADRERKRAIVHALGSIGDTDSFDFLADALEAESGYVRKEAADALIKMGNKRAIPCLFMRLERERYDDVREALLLSIIKIGRLDSYNGFVVLLRNENPGVREIGVRGLGSLADERAVSRLLTALNDESPKVRRVAAKALSSFKGAHIEDALRVSLMDDSSEVRIAAVQALMMAGTERSVPALTPLLEDSDPWVKTHVAEALGEIGGNGAAGILVDLLKDGESFMKVAAAKALGRLKDASVLPELERLLSQCRDWEVTDELERAIQAIKE